MNYRLLKPLPAIVLSFLFLISNATFSFAKFASLTIVEQFNKSTNVVNAKMFRAYPIKITEFIEYTLWEFDVLEEFKGKTYGKQNRIMVIGQTKHDWECPAAPAFKEGKTYILFLQKTNTRYLYGVVTDKQGEFEFVENSRLYHLMKSLGAKKN